MKKIGYVSGIFDLFHHGHRKYLLECRSLCDFLIVGVDSDDRTKVLKGNSRPIDSISTRLKNVKPFCDQVFEKTLPSSAYIEMYHPNIFFRSTDKKKLTLQMIISYIFNIQMGYQHLQY